MNTWGIFLGIALAAEPSTPVRLDLSRCMTYTVPAKDACNSCSCQKCTDGVTQWDMGSCACTLVQCGCMTANCTQPNLQPFDPNLWGKKK